MMRFSLLREQRAEQPDLEAQENFLSGTSVPKWHSFPSTGERSRGKEGKKACQSGILPFSLVPGFFWRALTKQKQYFKTTGKPDLYLLFLLEVLNVVFEA